MPDQRRSTAVGLRAEHVAECIEYRGLSIQLPEGCGYGVTQQDGSLKLTIEKPCAIVVSEGASSRKRRSVGTPGSEQPAVTFASAAPPAAPRRRTRSRTQAAEELSPAVQAPPADDDNDGGIEAAAAGKPMSPASKLAAAEAAADEEEWRWRAVAGAPSLPRWGHSVTRVGEGQLFILGGENADECFNSGHIYQLTEGRWSFNPIPARQVRFMLLLFSDPSSCLYQLVCRRDRLATGRGMPSRASSPQPTWTTPTRKTDQQRQTAVPLRSFFFSAAKRSTSTVEIGCARTTA